jgi:hypothetical protein
MSPKAIQPQDTAVSCAMCGRTLLQGETPEVYLVSGSRRHVCELCTVRANHQGWIRESQGLQIGHRGSRGDDRRPLLERLRRGRRSSARDLDGVGAPDGDAASEAPPAAPEVAEPAREGPREPRHVHAVPTSEELKAARAVDVFNASEHPRTVAGVARSLGAPGVAVHPLPDHASVVRIVVAWELCWYRYEVDLADEGAHGVRTAGQGYELGELSEAEVTPNAAADDHGLLTLP